MRFHLAKRGNVVDFDKRIPNSNVANRNLCVK